MSPIPDNAPAPRVSHVVKWPEFDGYGFNLHADKSKAGQYIGKVDENSPAECAGLLEGDRIVEVNGVNIANENHQQVVQRIKLVPNETRLLVVNTEADKWYKSHNLVVRGDQENIVFGTSYREEEKSDVPTENGVMTNGNVAHVDTDNVSGSREGDQDNRSVASAESSQSCGSSTQPQSPMSTTPTPPPSIETLNNTNNSNNIRATSTPSPTPQLNNNSTTNSTTNISNKMSGLNLNMTVAEMKAHLASKKKVDPRKSTMDLKKKHEIIQNM